jgi:hypothetical protein
MVSIAVNTYATGSVTVGEEIDSGIGGEVREVNDDLHPRDYAAVTSWK